MRVTNYISVEPCVGAGASNNFGVTRMPVPTWGFSICGATVNPPVIGSRADGMPERRKSCPTLFSADCHRTSTENRGMMICAFFVGLVCPVLSRNSVTGDK
jgi:hypothetical protein